MKLQKYGCGLLPKFDAGVDSDVTEAYIWVRPEDPEEIYNVAYGSGYEVVDKYATDEVVEIEEDELEDFARLEFAS